METFKLEQLNQEEKYLYKVKQPAKFAILYVDNETGNYILKNGQTKRIFKMSIKEFCERFEPIIEKK